MSVRSALGASRFQLFRQLMIESLILSTSGAFCGLLVALVTTRFVANASGLSIPLLHSVSVDGSALGFSAALAVAIGALVGIVPALEASVGKGASALRGSRRGMSFSRQNRRLRGGLVIAEVALASVLLVVGGLMLRSFHNVLDSELGFLPEEVVAWQITPSRSFETLAEQTAFFSQVAAEVKTIPGVVSVGLTDAVPLSRNRSWGLSAPGRMYGDKSYLPTFPYMIDRHYPALRASRTEAASVLRSSS